MSRKLFQGLSKYLVLAIVLAGFLMLLIPVSVVKADSPVNFPDHALEAAIRAAIHKPTGDIMQSDLVPGLTSLTAESDNITNLTGLEQCASLKDLDLRRNQISDISPLSGLTSLNFLNLNENQISDISPLSGLTSLTSLDLYHNQISDISRLSGLTNLTSLLLWHNQISDISPLSGLTSLNFLNLDENQISDISPLSGLTSLNSLYIVGNQISDIRPLSGLTNLTDVMLADNQISDISPLSGLTSMWDLYLSDNPISDISPLSGMTSLNYLFLDGAPINNNISPLSGMTSLTHLGLSDDNISDISPLSGLTSLTLLYLGTDHISDISPLQNLSNLGVLDLSTNEVADIQPLVSNPGLSSGDTVDLASNPLSCVSRNQYIPQLQARGVTVTTDLAGNTPVGSNVTVTLCNANISVTFDSVGTAGSTFAVQDNGPCGSLPSGYTLRGAIYHITTTALYDGNVTVSIAYPSGIPTPGDLRLFHCNGDTGWNDVTTSVDTVAGIIHGQDTALSWWAIGDPSGPSGGAHSGSVFPSIYIAAIAVAAAGVIGYAIYRRRVKA